MSDSEGSRHLLRDGTVSFSANCRPRSHRDSPEPTFVYRCYSADNDLLYIGISWNVGARMACHQSSSPWYRDVARVESVEYPCRAAAEDAEKAGIYAERPTHNVQHRRKDGLSRVINTARLMAKPDFDVLPKAMAAWRHERGMTQREVAKAANTTASTIARIELDDLNPSWFTFIAICNALAVNPEWVAQIRRWPENAKAVA